MYEKEFLMGTKRKGIIKKKMKNKYLKKKKK